MLDWMLEYKYMYLHIYPEKFPSISIKGRRSVQNRMVRRSS